MLFEIDVVVKTSQRELTGYFPVAGKKKTPPDVSAIQSTIKWEIYDNNMETQTLELNYLDHQLVFALESGEKFTASKPPYQLTVTNPV